MANEGTRYTPLSPGRPRAVLDESLLRELRARGYGYKRIAREYSCRTGHYISHMTVRQRLCADGDGGGQEMTGIQSNKSGNQDAS